MQESVRDECLKRLNYIDGHLHGVQRMIEEDAYCVDVLRQSFAVRRALEKVEAKLSPATSAPASSRASATAATSRLLMSWGRSMSSPIDRRGWEG